jgi:hypothetical protein
MIETGMMIGAAVILSFGISTACWEMRRSRCTSINCCGFKMERTLMTQESMNNDIKPQLNLPTI